MDEGTKSRIKDLELEIGELTAALEVMEKDKTTTTDKTDSLYTTINDFCVKRKSHSIKNDSHSVKTRSQPERNTWSLTQRDKAYLYETEEDYGLTELKGFERRYGDSWGKGPTTSTPYMGSVVPVKSVKSGPGLNTKMQKKVSIASLGLELSPTFIQRGLGRKVTRKVALMQDN